MLGEERVGRGNIVGKQEGVGIEFAGEFTPGTVIRFCRCA